MKSSSSTAVDLPHIVIFTDGCWLDTGRKLRMGSGVSGHAAVIRYSRNESEAISGTEYDLHHTSINTNNRAELRAVVEALKTLARRNIPRSTVEVRTDSAYVLRGATGNIVPGMHQDLWNELHRLSEQYAVSYRWTGAMRGDENYKRCHQLAKQAADELQTLIRPTWKGDGT
jgi:ribonuclease HI